LTATNFAGLASSATNLASGTANQIPYQTGAGATSFITAPSTPSTYLSWNGTAFAWATVSGGLISAVTGTAPINVTTTLGTANVSLNSNYGDTLNPYASKTANYVLAAPNGSAGAPTFRAIVAADIPTLNQNTTGTASNVTGTVAIANGGTGQTTANTAFNALAPSQTSNSGKYLTTDGTNSSWGSLPSSGKLLQLVSTTLTTGFSASVNNSFSAVTGLTASITPSSASSKVMITITMTVGSDTNYLNAKITKGGTAISGAVATTAGSRSVGTSAAWPVASYGTYDMTLSYLDSPATTSATTYGVQIGNSGAATLCVNQSQADDNIAGRTRGTSTITVMEIAA
jgi:hypothetical protein